ncbi:MAG: Nucleoid occlusion protein Noc [Thermoanaerobacterales bacterium 50_218]|nr:MAG: Nucleoid occlusion protein Noc [Thermoanaerobacterales bacterium 50_218]HAA89701.1 nucleoid occlusion protein [Peptococcaceae bacterium]
MAWSIFLRNSQRSLVVNIPIEKIRIGKFQPRYSIDEEELQELATSIRQVGVIQPVLVRPAGDYYELIAGERRMRATQLAGLKEIPAIVRDISDSEAAAIALVENLQRKGLHFFEEADGYARLISEFNMTQTDIARRMGLSQSTVANKLRLLRLSESVRKKIIELGLSERHARALLELESEQDQLELLEIIARKEMTVKEWEQLIRRKKGRFISQEIKKGKATKKMTPIIKDLKLFMNSLERGIKTLRDAGLYVELHHHYEGNKLQITIEVEVSEE